MPVSEITTDPENLTMMLIADAAVPRARLWRAFTDPSQLDRFWGPPGWPARFTEFDFRVGGHARYEMTNPQGEHSTGGWEFLEIDEGVGFTVLDAFLNDDGELLEGMPSMRVSFAFEETETGSRLVNVTYFDSIETLEQIVSFGAVEGTRLAMNQLDRVLASLRESGSGAGTELELLSDTQVRITRVVAGPAELVWRAYTEPELLRRWMLGPDGWTMDVAEIEPVPGTSVRSVWSPVDPADGEPFGFHGEVLLVEPGVRLVTTEHMIGTDLPSTTNDLSLYEEDGLTLVTLLIEYPDLQTRDLALSTGMADGIEASYDRLETAILTGG